MDHTEPDLSPGISGEIFRPVSCMCKRSGTWGGGPSGQHPARVQQTSRALHMRGSQRWNYLEAAPDMVGVTPGYLEYTTTLVGITHNF